MKWVSLFFVLTLVAVSVRASDGGRSLDQQVRSEIEYALASGISSGTGMVSASRVWVPVTPRLAEIFEKESPDRILAILERMKNEVRDPKHSRLWSYVGMCQMVFPEKEHAEPSTIVFSARRSERVVFYRFPLERLLRPILKKRPNQPPEPTPTAVTPAAAHPSRQP